MYKKLSARKIASEQGDSQTLINQLQMMEEASVDVFVCLNALKARITQM